MMTGNQTMSELRHHLQELHLESRALDATIARLSEDPMQDQLQLYRSKKRKLQLKNIISRLESQLIPDLDA
ncbi:conserved hypothetical protein [Gammaproteobacteria bacterium]